MNPINPKKQYINTVSGTNSSSLFGNGSLSIGGAPTIGKKSTAVPSNIAATNTQPTKITAPVKLPPAGQEYAKNLVNTGYSTIEGPYDPKTGQLKTPAAPTSSTPSAPTAPANTPAAPSTTDTAFAAYIESLKPSREVSTAQSAYNTAVADRSKTEAGFEGQGRGIPLGLVRGQQEKYLRQTQPELARLQGEIGIAQDSASAISNAAKAKVDYLQGKDKNTMAAEQTMYDRSQDTIKNATTSAKTISDAAKVKADTELANKKFEEDKRQYGLDYALKAKELNLKEQDAAAKANPAQASELKGNALTSAQSLLNSLNTLGKSAPIGLNGILGTVPGTKYRDFSVNFDNLKALLSLDNVKLLKGQGAVSDSERRLLEQASAKLDKGQSHEAFRSALTDVITALSGGTTVTDPSGGVHTFNSKADADAFQKAIGQ